MERIEKAIIENENKNYYVSWSLGKDSTVVVMLIKMCYELGTIPYLPNIVFSDTRVEFDAQKRFLDFVIESGFYPKEKIVVIKPDISFIGCIKKFGKPMESKIKDQFIETYQKYLEKNDNKLTTLEEFNSENTMTRLTLLLFGRSKKDKDKERSTSKFKISDRDMHIIHPNFDIKVSSHCCDELKKKPFEKYALENDCYFFIDGEMASEGGIRESNYHSRISTSGKACTTIKEIGKGKEKRIVKKIMPIIDWSSEVEEKFIKKYNIPLSEAYTKYGCKRTGCVICPYGASLKYLEEELKILYDFEPLKYKFAMNCMKDVYIARNVKCPYDIDYEKERINTWVTKYYQMRYEMIEMYRPNKKEKYRVEKFLNKLNKEEKIGKIYKMENKICRQLSLFDFME